MLNILRQVRGRINSRRKIPLAVTELYFKVKNYLPKNPIILEAGAHMGYDTYGLAKIWPDATIHAFEPVPEVFQNLVDRLKKLKNVRLYNTALGEKNGSFNMYVSSGTSTASSSILEPKAHLDIFPDVTFECLTAVTMTTLEKWAKNEKVSNIDLCWLDMQGYEVYALQGAGDLIKHIKVIYTELCKSELYSGLVTTDHYIEFLRNSGFELLSITGDDEITEGIFVNKSLL